MSRKSPGGREFLTDLERAWLVANTKPILKRVLGCEFGPDDSRGWAHSLCPLHGERNPSFGVDRDGACNCLGCDLQGDVVAVISRVRACSRREAADLALDRTPNVSDGRPGQRRMPTQSKTKNNGALVMPVPEDAPALANIANEVARHPYRGANGSILFYVVRIEPGREGKDKECFPYTLRRFPNGRLVWRSTLQGVTVRPLYGLNRIKGRTVVLLVEGEKAADAAHALWGEDMACVTTIGGAGQIAAKHDFSALKGLAVAVWPDRDEEGERYAAAVARSLLEAGVASVVVVEVPKHLPEKWDLADLEPGAKRYVEGFDADLARSLLDSALEREPLNADDLGAKCDSTGEPWGEIEEFDHVDLPDFPLHLLPPMIRETAAAVSDYPALDPAMAALSCLVTIGAAIALKAAVYVNASGQPTHLNLGALIVAEPTEGKSISISMARQAIAAALSAARGLSADEVRNYRRRRDMLEVQRKAALDRLKRSKPDPVAVAADLERIDGDLALLVPCYPLDFLADDITPEMLGRKMGENDGRVFVCSAEASFLANLSGRYDARAGKGGALLKIEGVLKALSNESVQVDRSGRKENIELTALSMLIGTHPNTLAMLRAIPDMIERGLFSRLLFMFPREHASTRRFRKDPTRPDVDAFDQLVRTLTVSPLPAKHVPLYLTDEAREIYAAFYNYAHEQIAEGGDFYPIRAWAARAPEHVARMVGNLHVAGDPSRALATAISDVTMSAAVGLVRDYFAAHVSHAYLGGPGSVSSDDARYLANRWYELARQQERRILKKSELTERAPRFRTSGTIDPVLQELQRRQIARNISAKTGAPGKPSERWELNPAYKPKRR